MSAKPISVYPSAELRARLERHAEAQDRSLNWLCLRWIEEGLAEAEQAPILRSIGVMGDTTIDMVTREPVDPATLAPLPKTRTESCIHGRKPNEYCKRCDT